MGLSRDLMVRTLMEPLKPFMEDVKVTEVAVNRAEEVWINTFSGWEKKKLPEFNEASIRALINAVAVYNNIKAEAINSVQFPDGERGEICLPPACVDGTVVLTIRKHSSSVFTLEELHEQGSFDDAQSVLIIDDQNDLCNRELLELKESDILLFLEKCVLYKKNIIIAGKTGSGKTTFARSLIEKIPQDERIVTIEDVHELFLENHENKVHLLHGTVNGRASPEECLRSCMRLSPDRILLAELRGGEAWEYLNSLNTGHPGSITTVHANNAIHTIDRIAVLIKNSRVGAGLDMDLIKYTLYKTLDVILYFEERKLKEVFFDPMFVQSLDLEMK